MYMLDGSECRRSAELEVRGESERYSTVAKTITIISCRVSKNAPQSDEVRARSHDELISDASNRLHVAASKLELFGHNVQYLY